MARLDFDVPSFFARLLEQVGLDCPLPNKLGIWKDQSNASSKSYITTCSISHLLDYSGDVPNFDERFMLLQLLLPSLARIGGGCYKVYGKH